MDFFWELNKINCKKNDVLKNGIDNKVFLKKTNELTIAPKMTEIINKDNIIVYFDFILEAGQKIVIDNVEYVLEKTPISKIFEEEKTVEVNNDEFDESLENFEIIPPPEITITHIEETIKIIGNVNENVYLLLEYYTTESYPEVPFKEEKFNINISKEYIKKIQKHKGVKCLVKIESLTGENLKSLLLDNKPLYHFSTINSLKKDITDLGVKVATYSDEELKRIITEKSIVLYSKFGLLSEQTYNPELTPIYKVIVNLYCIKDLMALGFLTGELQSDTSGDGENVFTSANQIQLGNLSVKEGSASSSGTNSSSVSKISNFLGTTALEELIKIEEEKLILSIRELSKNVKKQGAKNYGYKQFIQCNK